MTRETEERLIARNSFSWICSLGLTLSVLITQQPAADAVVGHRFLKWELSAETQVTTPAENEGGNLEPGKPVSRNLIGGETHSYQIVLATDHYLRVVVEQRGIDLSVTLFGPDGKKLTETDVSSGSLRGRRVDFLSDSSGNYRLEVRSRDKNAAPGSYQAAIAELRPAAPEDGSRIAAQELIREGRRLESQGNSQSLRSAITKYEEALVLAQSAKDQAAHAEALLRMGLVYNALGENRKAFEYYHQALPLHQAAHDRQGEASTLNSIGGSHLNQNEYQEGLNYFNKALALFRAIDDRGGEAIALSNIGAAHRLMGQRQKALEQYDQALKIHREVRDRGGESIALNNIGAIYDRIGEKQKALEYYNQSLTLRRDLGDRRGEAVVLNNIALLHHNSGESQKALESYEQVLTLRREVGDRGGEAISLNNMGSAYSALGQKQKALDYFTQSLQLRRALRDSRGEGITLNNMGGVYHDLDQYQKAFDSYNQSLALRRATKDRSGEAATLTGMGAVFGSLGEKQKALDHFEQALSHLRALDDRRGQAVVLNNMGKIHRTLGDHSRALQLYNESLPLRVATSDRRGQSVTLGNIGMVYNSLGEHQKALEYCEKSLVISRNVEDRAGAAVNLDNIGSVYVGLRDFQKASQNYSEALSLRREVGDRHGEAVTLSNLAVVESKLGNLDRARTYVEASIQKLEAVRSSVVSPELRASYFASANTIQGFYIDLLMRMNKQSPSEGLLATALEASEQARARSLLELLGETGANIRQGVEPSLLERKRELQHQLNAKAESQMRLLASKHSAEQAEAMRKEINALTTEYLAVETQIRATSPRYAELTQPQPLGLKEIQQQLDPDSVLLEYALGNDRSYLWAVSTSAIKGYELPKRQDVEAVARRFYDLLTAQQQRERVAQADSEYQAAARALSEMLLGAVARELGTKRLVIVADGALQYVPFAALPDPAITARSAVVSGEERNRRGVTDDRQTVAAADQPLMVNHEIVSLPSASVLAVQRRETAGRAPAPRAVAVLADPVFDKDDDRVVKPIGEPAKRSVEGELLLESELRRSVRDIAPAGDGKIPRLPFSREEADAIIAIAPAGQSKKAVGFEANRDTATSPELAQFRIIHFATHGLLNNEHPELSGIVLSLVDQQGRPQEGFLRLHDLYNLNLRAELVVLSACQTGLGKDIKGEGLVGLTRGFMYAGSGRVVASLWKVDDLATAELMRRFYDGILREGLRPAAALRGAQIAMWKSKRWQPAHYWAPFVLQGEWK